MPSSTVATHRQRPARRYEDECDRAHARTRLGAIIDQTQFETVPSYIDSGRSEGAPVRLGGRRTRVESGGFYVEPTAFDDVRPDMWIAREEIFGPVLSTIKVDDAEAALRVGNSVIYGLAAAVWTRDHQGASDRARISIDKPTSTLAGNSVE